MDEPCPDRVTELFGDRSDLAYSYARHLATTGVDHGLLGPREIPRMWDRHLLNCAVMAPALPQGATVADIGSGAGLPGLVLAIARPDIAMTLVEPLQRRTRWLTDVVADLGLEVEVRQAKAETLWDVLSVDVVTARAVASLGELARMSLPLLSVGGLMIAMKGDRASDEVAADRETLTSLGVSSIDVTTWGHGVTSEPTTTVMMTLGSEAPRWRNPVGDGPARTAARKKERRKTRSAQRRQTDQG